MKTKKSTTRSLTNSALENCRIDASPYRGQTGKRFLLAVLLIGASLTVFLWGAGGISYGDSAHSTPLKVTANAQFYPTFGTPNDALVTADDAYLLVSVSEPTGIQVFKNPDFTNPCGGQQILDFPRPQPGGQPVRAVDGMQFFPGCRKSALVPQLRCTALNFFVWLV